MKIKAIGDRILVRLEPKAEQTDGGIYVVADIGDCRNIGVVESVGSKVSMVKEGDKILFHVFDELETPEKDLAVIRENSVLGVYQDE